MKLAVGLERVPRRQRIELVPDAVKRIVDNVRGGAVGINTSAGKRGAGKLFSLPLCYILRSLPAYFALSVTQSVVAGCLPCRHVYAFTLKRVDERLARG
ncbi:hypothetical protein D3C87_1433670 [compost metagenome]